MVARWLLAGVFMIVVQVILGGITRLTGSGLSITEWKPIMGALPPMGEQEWLTAFEKYKQIAQYKYLNNQFTLADFKFIFFWEWFHRLWARSLGVVFAIGFIYFWRKKYFRKEMIKPLVILFILGGLQGLIGWLMVATGLNDENLYVSHYALAIHFISALVLLCYTFWFALKLLVAETRRKENNALRKFSYIILAILLLQLIYGAFMAGLKAAPAAATWPDMNGKIIPANLFTDAGFWKDLTHNNIMVQFIHRGIAYLLVILTAWWFIKAKDAAHPLLQKTRWIPVFFILLQILLGILAVINGNAIHRGDFGIYEWMAQLHQVIAMFFLMSMIWMVYILHRPAKTN